MSLIIKEDVVEKGLAWFPSFWDDKPNAKGLLTSFLEEIQLIEDLLHDLNEKRSIDTAIGVQLDVIGALLNVQRDGRLDSAYRDALKDRTSSIRASGTIEDVKNISKILTGATICNVFNHYPAATYLFCNKPITTEYDLIINKAHMGGVRSRTMWFSGDNYFIPDGIDDEGNTISYLDSSEAEIQNSFTVTDPDETDYVALDTRGKLASLSPLDNPDITSGYIIDNNLNYIIDDQGNYITYVSTDGAISAADSPLFITNLLWVE